MIICFAILYIYSPVLALGCVRTLKNTTWFEEHLTEDNQKYMRKSINEEYRRQTAEKLNPLKDEPWPRHEWTEGRCLDAYERERGHHHSWPLCPDVLNDSITPPYCGCFRKSKSRIGGC